MVDIFSVVLVGSVVTYFMYQNINKVTEVIEEKTKDNAPGYARFSIKIQEYIRALKKDLDDDIDSSNPRFCKNEHCDEKKVLRELNDLIRKASFYETVLAKNKPRREVEADFVEILERLERVVSENCIDGTQEAEKLKNELFDEYQKAVG
jgi:gas vesicle protein